MNILLISNTYAPQLNGVSKSVYLLRQELIDAGHAVVVLTLSDPKRTFCDDIIELPSVSVPKYLSPDLRYSNHFVRMLMGVRFSTILASLREYNFDIIHCHDTYLLSYLSHKLSQALSIPWVHTFHTHIEEYGQYSSGLLNFLKNTYARFLTRRACNLAHLTTTPSSKMIEYLQDIGVQKSLQVLPNIISVEPRTEMKKNKNEFTFVYFGRVAPEKNLYTLISLFNNVYNHPLAQGKNVQLIIAGTGTTELHQLQKYVVDLKLSHAVSFTGAYSFENEELQSLLVTADVFLFTSQTETQGVVLVEALGLGLPVIALYDHCFEGVVINGKNGFLAQTEESFIQNCMQCVNDDDLLAKLQAGARQSYVHYQKSYGVSLYVDIYSNLLNQ